MDHDLAGLIELHSHMTWFKPEQIKCFMKQLLLGLNYLHKNNVLHRDIKASNLLINNQGVLKLADFGLARPLSKKGIGNYTNNVITLWYRPPELLLGSHKYGAAVDCWSVGCILGELLCKKSMFPGKTEIDQVDLIFRSCGSPTDQTWPDVKTLPWYKSFRPKKLYKPLLRDIFKAHDSHAVDLLERLLTLDPRKRITAKEALEASYFTTEPLPCSVSDIPQFPSSHEFTTRKRKRQTQESSASSKRQRVDDFDTASKYNNNNNYGNNRYPHPNNNHDSMRGYPDSRSNDFRSVDEELSLIHI
eukprot:TRINITY_DN9421_c0_g1_i5.p1 TRINITY_DN9421_c0_g1~~TRINITY_DN9421_c0_g1_i5.p1  ORF type:complete len:303 (-),score=48.55 TRINITY_DN9421_c0_g1_i5:26-934(-)